MALEFERCKIGDSLYLNYAQTTKFKSEGIGVYFIVPLEAETLASYSLLPEVLQMGFEGCPTLREVKLRLKSLYDTAISTSQYNIGRFKVILFSVDLLSDVFVTDGKSLLERVCSILRDMIYRPLIIDGGFDAGYVSRKQKTLIDAVRALVNKKSAYAVSRCRKLMYGENSLMNDLPFGSEDAIRSLTPTSLYKAYQRFLQEARIECYYEGTSGVNNVISALSFLKPPCQMPIPYNTSAILLPPISPVIRRGEDCVGARQGWLVIGFRYNQTVSPADHVAFALMLEVLAYSPIAKLFKRVRESLGLCYSCSAINDAPRGTLFLTAGIDNDKRDLAERAMMAQIRQIGRGRFTSEELEAARGSYISALDGLEDMPDSLELRHFRRRLSGFARSDADSITDQCALARAQTRTDIARAARRLIPDTVFFLRAVDRGDSLDTEDADDE